MVQHKETNEYKILHEKNKGGKTKAEKKKGEVEEEKKGETEY